MKKGFLAFALILLLAAPSSAEEPRTAGTMPETHQQQDHSPRCMNLQDMHRYLMREEGLAYAATAIRSHHKTVQLYVSSRTGKWVVIEIDDDFYTCIIMDGYEWGWALPSNAVNRTHNRP